MNSPFILKLNYFVEDSEKIGILKLIRLCYRPNAKRLKNDT